MQTIDSLEPKSAPLHSRLKHNMPLTLGSEQSILLFKRYFPRADNAFYMITKVLKIQRRSEEATKNASIIDALMLQFLNEIESTTSTLNQAYQSNRPVDCDPFTYENNAQFQAACSTHFSVKLLNIYEKLDHLMGLCEALEIIGQLPPDSSEKLIDSWVRRFRQFCTHINELRAQSFPVKKAKKASGS